MEIKGDSAHADAEARPTEQTQCLKTGTYTWSDSWKRQPACDCVNCRIAQAQGERDSANTRATVYEKTRQIMVDTLANKLAAAEAEVAALKSELEKEREIHRTRWYQQDHENKELAAEVAALKAQIRELLKTVDAAVNHGLDEAGNLAWGTPEYAAALGAVTIHKTVADRLRELSALTAAEPKP